jgi:hypothetical protein
VITLAVRKTTEAFSDLLPSSRLSLYNSGVLRRSGLERASVALRDAMKDYGLSANVVSAGQGPQAESLSAQRPNEAHRSVSGEQGADELATALAIMHATLESTRTPSL